MANADVGEGFLRDVTLCRGVLRNIIGRFELLKGPHGIYYTSLLMFAYKEGLRVPVYLEMRVAYMPHCSTFFNDSTRTIVLGF